MLHHGDDTTMGWLRSWLDTFADPLFKFNNELKERNMTTTSAAPKNKAPKHAAEFLKLINDADTDQNREELLSQYGKVIPLSMLLSLNFNDRLKLDLPAGPPPYKRDEATHPDLMTPLSTQITRLKACLTTNNIPKYKKEQVFIQTIEMVPPCDADVLVACKDKALEELYPNITKQLVAKVFPNYV